MSTSLLKCGFSTLGFVLLMNSVSGRSAQAETASFTAQPPTTAQALEAPANDSATQVAQIIGDEQADRSRFSLGVSGNVGITGDTAMGESSLSLTSRIGLTDNLSLRPSVGFTSDPNITVPLTVDFPTRTAPDVGVSVAPYIGGGVVITTGDDGRVGPMATAGLDIPITNGLGASVAVDVGFLDETEVGASAGLSYSF